MSFFSYAQCAEAGWEPREWIANPKAADHVCTLSTHRCTWRQRRYGCSESHDREASWGLKPSQTLNYFIIIIIIIIIDISHPWYPGIIRIRNFDAEDINTYIFLRYMMTKVAPPSSLEICIHNHITSGCIAKKHVTVRGTRPQCTPSSPSGKEKRSP